MPRYAQLLRQWGIIVAPSNREWFDSRPTPAQENSSTRNGNALPRLPYQAA